MVVYSGGSKAIRIRALGLSVSERQRQRQRQIQKQRLQKQRGCLFCSAIHEWDVILWKGKVGRVETVEKDGALICDQLEGERGDWWTVGSRKFTLSASEAKEEKEVICLDYDYEQRQIQDRVANPHSEHAEEIFFVKFPDGFESEADLGRSTKQQEVEEP